MPVELKGTHLVLLCELSPQQADRSRPNESILEVITHDMALPLSCSLGTEVPVPDIDGTGIGGGRPLYPCVHGATEGGGG